MRKLLAILLLCIYLFNLSGYTVFFHVLIDRADHRMETALDNRQYSDKELLEIKLPLPMPYATNNSGYLHVNGHLVADGRYYNYVKRKISSDTLYLYCIPNHQADLLLHAKNEYGKQVNDLPASQKEKDMAKKESSAFQYQEPSPDYAIAALGILLSREYQPASSLLPSSFINTPYRPPKA